jgi:hypothetical protein
LDVSIRRGTPDDADAFCDLFNRLYDRHVDARYFRWRFFSTPFPTDLWVASAGGEPVGFYGAHHLPAADGRSRHTFAVDIMVRPKSQRRGVFRHLASAARKASFGATICVMANVAARDAHVRADGWSHVSTIPTYVAEATPVDPDSAYTVRSITRFADRHTRLWDALAASQPQLRATRRDASYLNWRFADNPWHDYTAFEFERNSTLSGGLSGGIRGYLVAKTFRDPATGAESGDLVDMAWEPDDLDAPAAILRHGLGHFEALGIARVSTWFETNTRLDEIGANLGFRETSLVREFCARPLGPGDAGATRRGDWYLTMSDADMY